MWPFKKNASLNILPVEEQKWSVLELESNELPLLVRLNTSAKDLISHPDLGIRVGFAIPLLSPNKGGMPEPNENLKLNEIEDFIINAIHETGPMVQALTITTGEFKEFVFYIKNSDGIETAHKKAQSAFTEYEIQCMGEHDPEWNTYKEFLNA